MSCFSHIDGNVAEPFSVFVYLSVDKCVSALQREFCVPSLFGGGFLTALEVQRS